MGQPLVDGELVNAFARDGVVCLREVLDEDELRVAATAVDIALAHPSPLTQVASGVDDPGSFTEDFCRWQEIGESEALAKHSMVAASHLPAR